MKKNELKKLFKSAITSKILLYTISLISFANLLYFLNENYLGGIIIFLFVGLLSHHYTNNMIIILIISIIVSNLLVIVANVCNKNSKKEGLANSTAKTDAATTDAATTDAESTDTESTDNTSTKASTDTKPSTATSNNTTSSDNNKQSLALLSQNALGARTSSGVKENKLINDEESGDEDSTTPSSTTENLTNLLDRNPKNFSAIKRTNDTSLENAQMLRDVQGQLETLIGGNGIQNLDTTELLKQQKELMLAIKQMQPLIDGATGMMDKISGSGIGSLLGLNKKNNDK